MSAGVDVCPSAGTESLGVPIPSAEPLSCPTGYEVQYGNLRDYF